MITDDLKTLIDAQWSNPSSVTQTCLIFIAQDPEQSENPVPTTTKVFNIIIEARGLPTRKGHGSDKWRFEGTLLVYATSIANMKVAFAEHKSIANANTDGTLFLSEPNIEGDERDGQYIATILFTWLKTIAH